MRDVTAFQVVLLSAAVAGYAAGWIVKKALQR